MVEVGGGGLDGERYCSTVWKKSGGRLGLYMTGVYYCYIENDDISMCLCM